MSFATSSFPALGSIATVTVDDGARLAPARAAVEREIAAIDRACSRFRADSDLARVNAHAGHHVRVSRTCIAAIDAALTAAIVSAGRVDPTVGRAMRVLGYDRDYAQLALDGPPVTVTVGRVPGWQCVQVDHRAATVRVPVGVELDLGATAKALCADRAARAAHERTGVGVVVGLGGDLAIAGDAPEDGWPVRVTDDLAATCGGQLVSVRAGGVATSGTNRRRWTRGGVDHHHVLDPRTGHPVDGPWRTVSVAAASCLQANVATSASIVIGAGAPDWLRERRLPARLVSHDGAVVIVAGWPQPESVAAGSAA